MSKYVIEDIGFIVINGEKHPWNPCEIEMTQEEIRGGIGTYKPKIKHVENANKELKWKKDDIK